MTVCCPECGTELQSEPRLIGRVVRCSVCKHRFIVGAPLQGPQHLREEPQDSREDDDFYTEDDNEELRDGMADDDSDENQSEERQYYDSHGSFVGYRDESGWFHGEGGHNYMGYMEDDGRFYDGTGTYRGQVEDSGFVWEEGKGYTGVHEGNGFSENGHYGVPDIYERGGDGTGGVFDSLMDDEDDC